MNINGTSTQPTLRIYKLRLLNSNVDSSIDLICSMLYSKANYIIGMGEVDDHADIP